MAGELGRGGARRSGPQIHRRAHARQASRQRLRAASPAFRKHPLPEGTCTRLCPLPEGTCTWPAGRAAAHPQARLSCTASADGWVCAPMPGRVPMPTLQLNAVLLYHMANIGAASGAELADEGVVPTVLGPDYNLQVGRARALAPVRWSRVSA